MPLPDEAGRDRDRPYTGRERLIGGGFVAVQFVLLGVLVALPGRTDGTDDVIGAITRGAGCFMAGCGLAGILLAGRVLGRGLTAMPLPNDRAQLRTGGLYRWVRHPIYSFLLLGAAGFAVLGWTWWHGATLVALLGVLRLKARWEEGFLLRRFAGYREYARVTPRFVPRLARPARHGAAD